MSNVPGFTGDGFADYQHGTGDFVEFTYNAPAAGDYLLAFRYANGSTADRPLELKVNGAVAQASLPFAPTGKWSAWGAVAATVALPVGVNKIRLTSIGKNGPNLDAMSVNPGRTGGGVGEERGILLASMPTPDRNAGGPERTLIRVRVKASRPAKFRAG